MTRHPRSAATFMSRREGFAVVTAPSLGARSSRPAGATNVQKERKSLRANFYGSAVTRRSRDGEGVARPLRGDAPLLSVRVRRPGLGEDPRARGLRLRAPDVGDHRRLPPVLLASVVQDEPRVPVRARVPRNDGDAERSDLVGELASPTSQVLRHARSTRTRRGTAASGTRTSAGSSTGPTIVPTSPTSRTSSATRSCASSSAHKWMPIVVVRGRVLRDRRRFRSRLGLRREHHRGAARDGAHQLACPRLGLAPVRHQGRLAQQRAARGVHARRRAGTTTTTTRWTSRVRAFGGGRST